MSDKESTNKSLCFSGTSAVPKPGRYFAKPDLCQYGSEDPAPPHKRYRKGVVLAATYEEIQEVNDRCDGKHDHEVVRGWVKQEGMPAQSRAALSACAAQPMTEVSLRSPPLSP